MLWARKQSILLEVEHFEKRIKKLEDRKGTDKEKETDANELKGLNEILEAAKEEKVRILADLEEVEA